MSLVGTINPPASLEEGIRIKADCHVERYRNDYGTPMLRITHLPTGSVIVSNRNDEYDSLSLLAANLNE